MVQNLSDEGGLGDEGQELHRGLTSGTGHGVDLVNAIDELGHGQAAKSIELSGLRECAGFLADVIRVLSADPTGPISQDPTLAGRQGSNPPSHRV